MDPRQQRGPGHETGARPPRPTSLELLRRARGGDGSAVDALFARHLPSLHRWAHGRLPGWARQLGDTADIVQDSVLSVFGRLDAFEPRREGAFRAYLRQAVLNRIRDHYRRAIRRPGDVELDSAQPDDGTSPLEAAISSETIARYSAALQTLKPEEREAVVARVELGYSYEQVASMLRKRSPDAARVMVNRALVKVARQMSNAARHQ